MKGIIHKDSGKERFWSKVDIKDKDDCWNWQGAIGSRGYGIFQYRGKAENAHRIVWKLVKGTIPEGLYVLHKCDNKTCCNIDHLYLGTHTDNVSDVVDRGLNIYPNKAKLYEGEIRLIRRLRIVSRNGIINSYKFSATMVASMFKVDRATILKIWNNDKYLCKEGYYC